MKVVGRGGNEGEEEGDGGEVLPFFPLLLILFTSPFFYFALAEICTSSCSSIAKNLSTHSLLGEEGKNNIARERVREREQQQKSAQSPRLPPVQI